MQNTMRRLLPLHRTSSSSSFLHTYTHTPVFAKGYDAAQGARDLETLLRAPGRGRWSLIPGGRGVERVFRFKGFGGSWDFMNVVAQECKVQKHHPEWSNVYNTVFVRWTTHSPAGLSEKDTRMARFCDEAAANLGEVEADSGEALGRELVDRVVAEGADRCVPVRKGQEKVDGGSG